MTGPDAAAIARFRADLEALTGARPPVPLALAVSGGPDSMALLALAAAAFPGGVTAATVDHGLRPEAASEAAMVAEACATLGVPHAILRVEAPIGPSAIQADARERRYALLAGWALAQGATLLLTAHQADDQAETFLMRAVRGTGPAGLAGVRALRDLAPGLRLARPLLGWRREELRTIAPCFVDDPSNEDERFERVRVRRLLAETPWLDPQQLAAAAAHAGEADAALDAYVALLWDQRRVPGGDPALDLTGLPREARRRLVRRAIGEVRAVAGLTAPPWSDSANVESLLDSLESGSGASQAGVMVARAGRYWRFRPAPPRRSQ